MRRVARSLFLLMSCRLAERVGFGADSDVQRTSLQTAKTTRTAADGASATEVASTFAASPLRRIPSRGEPTFACWSSLLAGLPTEAASEASDWRRLAERVGFAPLLRIENKELNRLRLPHDPPDPVKSPGRRHVLSTWGDAIYIRYMA
jgi:hypothetical protein